MMTEQLQGIVRAIPQTTEQAHVGSTLTGRIADAMKQGRDKSTPSSDLDTVEVRCAACQQTTSTYSIITQGDKTERNVWRLTQEKAAADGWKCDDKEFVCRLCSSREEGTDFPTFSGLECRCGKCGQSPVGITYERAGGEHLRRTCTVCGYGWNEAVIGHIGVVKRVWRALWETK